jgi:hypothetical protein
MTSLLTGWVRRAVRSATARPTATKVSRTRLSVTPLEDRAVPAGVPIDDGPPAVGVAWVADAAEGGAAGKFRFSRSGSTTNSLAVTVSYGGTATAGADYPALPTAVTIPAGSATADLSVPATDDAEYDPAETVTVTLVSAAGYTISAPGTATLTIIDNDPAPVVTVARVADAAEGGANGTFRFTRTGSTAAALAVSYTVPTVGPAMATPTSDYAALPGAVTIPAGAASKDVTVSVANDTTAEPREEVVVNLADGAGYTIGYPGNASVWITDNDSAGKPVVSVARVSDGTEGGAAGVYRFTRTGSTAAALTVNYAVDGSATAGVDYTALSGTISFAAGSATKDLTVAAINDALLEGTEQLFVSVKTGTGYVPAGGNDAVLNIQDDERGKIGGIVWRDGGDGIRQDAEGGAAGVPVALLDGSTEVFRETTTGTGGTYQFDDLPAGTYAVWLGEAVAGKWEYTLRNQGADETRDSDADPATGVSAAVTLSGSTTAELWVGAGFRTLDLSPPPPANTPPTVTPPSNKLIPTDGAPRTFAFTVGDVETPAGSLAVTATVLNPPGGSSGPVRATTGGSGSNRTVTVTAAPGWAGLATVLLEATDAAGAVTGATFNVVVRAGPNNPPVFIDHTTAGTTNVPQHAYTANVGVKVPPNALVVHTRANDPDPGDNAALKYTITGATTPSQVVPVSPADFTIDQNGTILVARDVSGAGSVRLTVKVEDPGGLSDTATVDITYVPLVALSETDPFAVEGSTDAITIDVYRLAYGGAAGVPLDVNYRIDWQFTNDTKGSGWGAASYADFDTPNDLFPNATATTGVIHLDAGETQKTIRLTAKADGIPERAEKFRITILDGPGYATINGGEQLTTNFPNTQVPLKRAAEGYLFDGLELFGNRDQNGDAKPKVAQTKEDPAHYNDIEQRGGPEGDFCYLLAAVAGKLAHDPAGFRNLFTPIGNNSYVITMHSYWGYNQTTIHKGTFYIKVTVDLGAADRGYILTKYADRDFGDNGGLEIWQLVLEKAYNEFYRQAGVGIGFGTASRASVAMRVLGWKASQTLAEFPNSISKEKITAAYNSGKAAALVTWIEKPPLTGTGPIHISNSAATTISLLRGHYYAVIGLLPNDEGVLLFNPFADPRGGEVVVPWQDLGAFAAYDYEL